MRLIAVFSEFVTRPVERVGHLAARAALAKAARTPAFLMGRRAELARVSDEVIAGVKVRRYVPHAVQPGVIVYFHGGGWVVCDVDTHDHPVSALAAATKREVISVDYRLAPEHRYPAALDDCLAVVAALPGSVVVAGDSAGGGLAAVVAQRLKEKVSAQVLLYPVTDCGAELPSYEQYATGHFLTRETVRFYRQTYVPDEAQRLEPGCSPLRAPSVKGVARAFVLLAQCDVLRDEGVAYAKKLEADGVDVTVHEEPGVLHGFINMQGLVVAREAVQRLARWLASPS